MTKNLKEKTLLKLDAFALGIMHISNRYLGSVAAGKNMLKPGNGKYFRWKHGEVFYHKYGKETKGFWADGHLFSKTVGCDSNNNIFKGVRKRPTLGAYSHKYQKFNINDSSDKISTCRTNLKTGKSSTNLKNFTKNFGIDVNSEHLSNYNEDNKDDESINSLKVNKISRHKHLKSDKI